MEEIIITDSHADLKCGGIKMLNQIMEQGGYPKCQPGAFI
jgi:hypothetical protein|tara:strand:- start:1904 stop:2023 length:120 start_codon:yes stop_codon:yes gene_type:complete